MPQLKKGRGYVKMKVITGSSGYLAVSSLTRVGIIELLGQLKKYSNSIILGFFVSPYHINEYSHASEKYLR